MGTRRVTWGCPESRSVGSGRPQSLRVLGPRQPPPWHTGKMTHAVMGSWVQGISSGLGDKVTFLFM